MALIELRNVFRDYGPRRVLAGVNLAIEEGEFVSIVGVSASGKTTLLKLASGLLAPTSGSVTIGGRSVHEFPHGAAIVFQNYSLLPWLSALANVELAVESAFPDWPASRRRDQAVRYLEKVGLQSALAKRPSQLSGGMRQRVAIARAFAVEPNIIFLDEPFGALDALTRATLQQELADLCQARSPRVTALMITNSVDEAVLLSDRILALGRGPAATLSAAVPVPLPRPRSAKALLQDEQAVKVRARVTEFLLAGSRSPAPRPQRLAPAAESAPVEVRP
jgi:nitrate/nitrite transport system ATP-binding protein